MTMRTEGQRIVALATLMAVMASNTWAQTHYEVQKLVANVGAPQDIFGDSVAVHGDTAVIGASGDGDLGGGAGAVYVFTRDAGNVWTMQQKLTASDGTSSDGFGNSVAVEGDTMVIGSSSHFDASGSYLGAAYVFTRDAGGVWTEQQELFASDGPSIQNSDFGTSVAIDGDTVVVGDFNGDSPFLPGLCSCFSSGTAYVFTRDAGGVWTEQQKLFASDRANNNFFGQSVAVDGDTVLIGAPRNGEVANLAGAAYVFTRDADDIWTEQQKLTASDGAALDTFGNSVAMDGDTAVIGAANDDDNGNASGSVYVFTRNQLDIWIEQPKLNASDGVPGDSFGGSVAMDGSTAVIGSAGDDDNGDGSGSAYVFTRSAAGAWSEHKKLGASDGADTDFFSNGSIAVNGDAVLIGADSDDDSGDSSGSAYAYLLKPFTTVVGLADTNNNGFPDVAVIAEGASSHVHIRDGNTGELIIDIDFGDDPITAMAVLDDIDGNGMSEIALLGTRPDNNVRVQVKDSQTGATVNNIFYGSSYSAVDMTVLPDSNSNGADELLVVGASSTGGVRVQARDALTDAATSTTFYGSNMPPQDVITIPDVSTNGEPEVVIHGRVTASGQSRAQMRDSATRAFLSNMFFGTAYLPRQLTAIEDVSGDGLPDLAQLGRRGDTGAARIQVKRSDTGATVSNAYTGGTDIPIAVVGIGDANGNTFSDVAMLVKRPDRTAHVIIRDGATGAFIRNIFAGAVSNPVAMTLVDDLDASGLPELAILGDDGAGTKRVQIKDSISGAQVNIINFP